MGNTGGNDVAYPAAYADCLAVGSTTPQDTATSFSNFGPHVDVSAPSEFIWSTWLGGQYAYERAPSSASAAAFAAGVASLVLSYAPQLSAAEVRRILVESADDLGEPGWDMHFGAGRVNAGRALTMTPPPALRFEHVDPLPSNVSPDGTTSLTIEILNAAEQLVLGSPVLILRVGKAAFQAPIPLVPLGNDLFSIRFPMLPCETTVKYYVAARGNGGALALDPRRAPDRLYTAYVTGGERLFDDDMEEDHGWETEEEVEKGSGGAWTRVIPVGTTAQPGFDRTEDFGRWCFVTGQHVDGPDGMNDVDGGPVRLVSPVIPLTSDDAEVTYWRWFHSTGGTSDRLMVEVSRDGGATWAEVETGQTTSGWTRHSFRVGDVPQITGDRLRVRFSTADSPNDSLTEAAIDEFHVRSIRCQVASGDADGDGDIDLTDFQRLGDCWSGPGALELPGAGCAVVDFDADGRVDLRDYQAFQIRFGTVMD